MKYIFLFLTIFCVSHLSAQTAGSSLQLHITEASNDQGMIRVLIFSQASGFPDNPAKAVKSYSVPPKKGAVSIAVPGLPPGSYAIAVIHDKDGNGKLSTNAVGYPSERYGFSNNPKVYFGPPSFDKAAIDLGLMPQTVRIVLH
jgi:uncharacterized protein (DUF2141 family)